MAGITILSGSLITGPASVSSPRHTVHCTIDAVLETVKTHLSDCDTMTIKRRSVLLAYCLYSLLMDSERYQDKFLLPLRDPEGISQLFVGVGDIAISDENGDLFECIQILPDVSLTPALVEAACAKVLPHTPRRFCLLTTTEPYGEDTQTIRRLAGNLSYAHHCEVIVDGFLPTLSYGLRVVTEPSDFLIAYAKALHEDQANKLNG